jgi:hypothetical protein
MVIGSVINPVTGSVVGGGGDLRPPAGFVFWIVNGQPMKDGDKYMLRKL